MKVSVIIPVYFDGINSRRHYTLRNALESVEAQDYKAYEIIIYMSGLKKNLEVINIDKNAKLIYSSRKTGPAQARNIAAAQAKGDILAFLDSDDIWSPHYLSLSVKKYINQSINATCAYAISTRNGEVASRTPNRKFRENTKAIVHMNYIHTMSAFTIRKKLFYALGGFTEKIAPCEDLDLYIRLSLVSDVQIIPYFLVHRYLDQDNLTNDMIYWSKRIYYTHKKLFHNPQFVSYKRDLAIGGFNRLLRLYKKARHHLDKVLILSEISKYIFWLMRKPYLFTYRETNDKALFTAFDCLNLTRKMNKNLAMGQELCLVQLSQSILDLNKPFFESQLVTDITDWLLDNKLVPICVPSNITKGNDDRLPLSLIAASYGREILFTINTIGNKDLERCISLSSIIITSDYNIAKIAIYFHKPIIGIGNDNRLFSLFCENGISSWYYHITDMSISLKTFLKTKLNGAHRIYNTKAPNKKLIIAD